MPLYLCRWPNGDCSVVGARNKEDAIIKLDEVGNAEGCPLIQLRGFQVHFTLTEAGTIGYEAIGESTEEQIMTFAYPQLKQVLSEVYGEEAPPDGERFTRDQAEKVRIAIEHERHRIQPNPEEMADPETEMGRKAKQQTGMATPLVNRIVQNTATQILQDFKGKGKPQ